MESANKPHDKDAAREFLAQIFGQRITSMQIQMMSRFIQIPHSKLHLQ